MVFHSSVLCINVLTCTARGPYNAAGYIPKGRKDIKMPSDRRRILQLALESLEAKKRKLDAEIAEIARELRIGATAVKTKPAATVASSSARRRSKFSHKKGRDDRRGWRPAGM